MHAYFHTKNPILIRTFIPGKYATWSLDMDRDIERARKVAIGLFSALKNKGVNGWSISIKGKEGVTENTVAIHERTSNEKVTFWEGSEITQKYYLEISQKDGSNWHVARVLSTNNLDKAVVWAALLAFYKGDLNKTIHDLRPFLEYRDWSEDIRSKNGNA